MRISTLQSVVTLSAEHTRLARQKADVENDQAHVIIRGQYQDDAMTALIRPVLLREINARLSRIYHQLVELGVDVDSWPD